MEPKNADTTDHATADTTEVTTAAPPVPTGQPSHNPGAADASPDRLLRFFEYEHLPPHLQKLSKPYYDLARAIVAEAPASAERTVALRKLVESKDAAVRCFL